MGADSMGADSMGADSEAGPEVEQPLAFVVFPTGVGDCAIVWRVGGAVVGSTLPQGGADQVRCAVRRWYPGAVESEPTADVAEAVERVTRLLDHGGEGDATPTADIELDMGAVPEFDRRVYEVVRRIPPGETLTYGEVAALLGAPGSAQAVGQALGRNPFPPIVPCHRVLAAGGKIGGFSARGGARTKLRMLVREGALMEQPTLFEL
ncbi:methylated-DNA--[protein]-cysteine S-methyltransferase [Myceligenerans halotolerans]